MFLKNTASLRRSIVLGTQAVLTINAAATIEAGATHYPLQSKEMTRFPSSLPLAKTRSRGQVHVRLDIASSSDTLTVDSLYTSPAVADA